MDRLINKIGKLKSLFSELDYKMNDSRIKNDRRVIRKLYEILINIEKIILGTSNPLDNFIIWIWQCL